MKWRLERTIIVGPEGVDPEDTRKVLYLLLLLLKPLSKIAQQPLEFYWREGHQNNALREVRVNGHSISINFFVSTNSPACIRHRYTPDASPLPSNRTAWSPAGISAFTSTVTRWPNVL